jgi:predicted nucleic acid-binding protein
MIVVDTNILAFLFIQGDHSASVEGLYKKDSNWVAPTLWKD